LRKIFGELKIVFTFAIPSDKRFGVVVKRELSSAGSEHLPYKQRVTGSNPVAPTGKVPEVIPGLFCYLLPVLKTSPSCLLFQGKNQLYL
jgi:hypothetical protein